MRRPSGLTLPRNNADVINSLALIICPVVVRPFSSVIVRFRPSVSTLMLVGLRHDTTVRLGLKRSPFHAHEKPIGPSVLLAKARREQRILQRIPIPKFRNLHRL